MTTTCKICGERVAVDNKPCKCNSSEIFATSQDVLTEASWDILKCIQNPEEREKKKKELQEFLEGLN